MGATAMRSERGTDRAFLTLYTECTQCGAAGRYAVAQVHVSPPAILEELGVEADPDWDGVFVPQILECVHCGSPDTYQLTARTRCELLLRATAALLTGTDPDAPVVPQPAGLFDGTVAMRATQVLHRLRGYAEASPHDGSVWRRLGNFCERIGRPDEASTHWNTAVDVDEREMEAAYSLAARCWAVGAEPQAIAYSEIGLARWPHQDPRTEAHEQMVRAMLDVLAELRPPHELHIAWRTPGPPGRPDQVVVTMSGVALHRVPSWPRLARLLLDEEVFHLQFVPDDPGALPDDGPSELERWLAGVKPTPLDACIRLDRRTSTVTEARKDRRARRKRERRARKRGRRAGRR